MPQVAISIGGRSFDVACQEGEEHFLQTAAKMLDEEAQHISSQVGRMPEARMLLMAGLMLADKTSGMQERLNDLTEKLGQQEALIAELRDNASEPPGPSEDFTAMVAKSEALADALEKMAT